MALFTAMSYGELEPPDLSMSTPPGKRRLQDDTELTACQETSFIDQLVQPDRWGDGRLKAAAPPLLDSMRAHMAALLSRQPPLEQPQPAAQRLLELLAEAEAEGQRAAAAAAATPAWRINNSIEGAPGPAEKRARLVDRSSGKKKPALASVRHQLMPPAVFGAALQPKPPAPKWPVPQHEYGAARCMPKHSLMLGASHPAKPHPSVPIHEQNTPLAAVPGSRSHRLMKTPNAAQQLSPSPQQPPLAASMGPAAADALHSAAQSPITGKPSNGVGSGAGDSPAAAAGGSGGDFRAAFTAMGANPSQQARRFVIRRSCIQGTGLYTTEPLFPGQLLMEYVGVVIRKSVADWHEQQQQQQLVAAVEGGPKDAAQCPASGVQAGAASAAAMVQVDASTDGGRLLSTRTAATPPTAAAAAAVGQLPLQREEHDGPPADPLCRPSKCCGSEGGAMDYGEDTAACADAEGASQRAADQQHKAWGTAAYQQQQQQQQAVTLPLAAPLAIHPHGRGSGGDAAAAGAAAPQTASPALPATPAIAAPHHAPLEAAAALVEGGVGSGSGSDSGGGSGGGPTYLFALDADRVVDASRQGNIARFINHSCSPNCTAKTANVEGKRRIFLFAAKEVAPGEELTYDYKFQMPLMVYGGVHGPRGQEIMRKFCSVTQTQLVRCGCGAKGCRGYL